MLKKMRERRFDGRSFRVIYIDGKDYDGEMMIAALGIEDFKDRTKDGKKVLLGIRQGSTENTAVVTALLSDLRDRGVNLDQAMLFVVDGSKALTAGIRRVCGDQALIQRCRVHKKKNVLRHLNDGRHPEFHRRFNEAVELPHKDAKKELAKLVTWLEGINPDAAGSLKDGIDEIITVNRMEVSPLLVKTLVTTNPIESVFSIGEEATRRVKRWRGGNMRLRWFACAMFDAEQRLNRVKGRLFFAQFVNALEKEVARRRQEELEQVA
jgi:transposase-like protein